MLELLMDPLGLLVITFWIMSIISVAAIALVFLCKNEKLKKGLFYFLAVWGIIVAYCGVLSTPGYMIAEILITIALGALGLIAVLVERFAKKENRFQIARVLASVSVVAGMIDCFMI